MDTDKPENKPHLTKSIKVTLLVCVCLAVFLLGNLSNPLIASLTASPEPHGRLNVWLIPRDVKLYNGESRTFGAVVSNGTGPFNYTWMANGTIISHEPFFDFSFKEIVFCVILSVEVVDSKGNVGYDSTLVYDPVATGNYYLDTPLPIASFFVGEYTNGTFYGINGTNWRNFIRHSNGTYVVHLCVSNVTADGIGGIVYVGAGDYGGSGTVTVGDNCTLILETGVTNLDYITSGTGIVLTYDNGYVTIDAPLDLAQHQIIAGVFHAGSTKPASPVEAQFFYDTDDHVLYVWNTTDWVDCFAGVGGGAGWETKGSYDYFVYQDDSTNTTVIDNEGNKAYESANDGLAMNWAFDNGDEVYLAADTYTLIDDTGIVLDDTGDTLRGGGYSTRITVEAGFDGNIITVEATGARLDNFRIDGTGQTSGHGMFFDGSSGTITSFFRIQDCFGDGIHVGDTEWVVDNQMGGKIQFGTITANGGNGLYLDFDSTDWEVFDILISNHDATGKAGIVVDAGATMISFCHLWGNYYNVLLCPAHSISRLGFVNNDVMDNDYHGLYKSSAYYFHDSRIVGNAFWANGYSGAYDHSDSIYFGGTGDIRSITITGNSFYGFKEGGQPEVRCTRYAINDANAQMDYCVIGLNTFREYFEADPTNIATANNQESLNTVYQCG